MTNLEAIRLIRNLTTRCEFTDAYGEPIDSDAYYEAVDMAISALQAQEEKTQLSAEGTTSDLISRQAEIDAIVNKVSGIGLHDNSEVARYGATFRQHEIIDIIESLPSVQPETNCSEIPNNSDLISRRVAIDAVSKYKKEHGYAYYDCACEIEKNIKQLPSAQTEIVRCKDCKYRGGLSGFYCDIVEKAVGVDSFCSRAERRTDESD